MYWCRCCCDWSRSNGIIGFDKGTSGAVVVAVTGTDVDIVGGNIGILVIDGGINGTDVVVMIGANVDTSTGLAVNDEGTNDADVGVVSGAIVAVIGGNTGLTVMGGVVNGTDVVV